jgi:hypothetical protein
MCLDMTNPTDVLPALSGIARYVEHLHPGQYIAGMWEKDIALQLAWHLPRKRNLSRSVVKGPSFSWVSASQRCSFQLPENGYKARCTFLGVTQTLATANPYGHILECSITLRGRTIQGAKLSALIIQTRQKYGPYRELFAIMDDPACDFHVLLKSRGNTHEGKDISNRPSVVCLQLFREKLKFSTALVLQRHANETSYTRIGLVKTIDPTWFHKDGVEEMVTIT